MQPSLNIIKPKRTKQEWTTEERIKENARAKELKELRKQSKISTASRTNMIRIIMHSIHSMHTSPNHCHIHPQARKVHYHLLILHLHSEIHY